MIRNRQLFGFIVFFSITNIYAAESYLYLEGDLGVNYTITKSSKSINWTEATGSADGTYSENGLAGSLLFGYVKPFQKLFVGLNGGITYLNNVAETKTQGVAFGAPFSEDDSVKLNYFYELLLQGGYFLRDSSQLYFTIGPALGQFHFFQSYQFTTQTVTTSTNNPKSLWGIDVGVGIKERVSQHLALGLAIQYINFESQTLPEIHGNSLDKVNYNPSLLLAKIGVEYRF